MEPTGKYVPPEHPRASEPQGSTQPKEKEYRTLDVLTGKWSTTPPPNEKTGKTDKTIAALSHRIATLQHIEAQRQPVTIEDRLTPKSVETVTTLKGKLLPEIEMHKSELGILKDRVVTHIHKDWAWLTSLKCVGGIFEYFRDKAIKNTEEQFAKLAQKLTNIEEAIKVKLPGIQEYAKIQFRLDASFLPKSNFHRIHNEADANSKLDELSRETPNVDHMLIRKDPNNVAGLIISVKRNDKSKVEHIPIAIGMNPDDQLHYIRITTDTADPPTSTIHTGELEDLLAAKSWEEVSEHIGYSQK